jgi:hypothetical protein
LVERQWLRNIKALLWIAGWFPGRLLAATLNQAAAVWMRDWLETDHFDERALT